MITEDFVSFEIAKLLKEKGFDETCRAFWKDWNDELHLCDCSSSHVFEFCFNSMLDDYNDEEETNIAAPTLQMAMKWLREVHKKHCEIYLTYRSKWSFSILDTERTIIDHDIEMDSYVIESQCTGFKSYEEASDAAIKYCLKKLI